MTELRKDDVAINNRRIGATKLAKRCSKLAKPEVILHIGLHKTGSSSFQAVMTEHRADFLAAGIAPYVSKTGKTHSKEISLAILRDGVFETPDKADLFETVRQQIGTFMSESTLDRFLFSSEHFSLVRTEAEAERLRSLFPPSDLRFHILLIIREKQEWFESYKAQTLRSGDKLNNDHRSAHNFNADTWLVDFDTMIDVFRRNFGRVTIIDYDKQDAISPLLAAMEVKGSFNPKAYRRNRAPLVAKSGSATHTIVRTFLGTEHRGLLRFWRDLRERLTR